MLKNRVVTAEANGFKASKRVNRGCPQGGIKSTIYWNSLKQNLKKRLKARKKRATHTNVYADDDVKEQAENLVVASIIIFHCVMRIKCLNR